MKRNAPCPCGSGKKFKHCCLGREAREAAAWKRRSDEDVAYLARLQGITATELKESWRKKYEAAKAKARGNFSMAGVFLALYGGMTYEP